MNTASNKNVVFTITPEGYTELENKNHLEEFKEYVKNHFKGNYVICKETMDKGGTPVKPHFHIWLQDIDCKKDSFRTQLIKQFNELKRVGQNGSNKMSSISYLKEEIQFYYLFKNFETSEYTTNIILSDSLKKKYKENYLKIKQLEDLGENAKFYRYCIENLPQKLTNIKSLITAYLEYSVSINKKRINFFDCQTNINYILSRENPQSLIDEWTQRMLN